MNKKGTAGKKKHQALKIPQKLEIIVRHKVKVMASYNVRSFCAI